MGTVKTILTVVYFIVALVVIVLAFIQAKEDSGLGATISGSSTDNFYEKNKGKTKEGKQKRMLIFLSVVLIILSVALGIVYMM